MCSKPLVTDWPTPCPILYIMRIVRSISVDLKMFYPLVSRGNFIAAYQCDFMSRYPFLINIVYILVSVICMEEDAQQKELQSQQLHSRLCRSVSEQGGPKLWSKIHMQVIEESYRRTCLGTLTFCKGFFYQLNHGVLCSASFLNLLNTYCGIRDDAGSTITVLTYSW